MDIITFSGLIASITSIIDLLPQIYKMDIITFSGLIASITSIIGLLPQIYKTYKTKSAEDLSKLMLWNYLICSFAWIVYGIATDTKFVTFSNIIGLTSSIIAILQKHYYDAK